MKHDQGTTIVRNGQLIDGTGRAPIVDGTVVIRDGVIMYAGSAQESPLIENDPNSPPAKVIDLPSADHLK